MSLDFRFYPDGAKAPVMDHPNMVDPTNPENWHPLAHYLVFAMMACGITEISAKNTDMVLRRLNIYQKLVGPALRFGDGEKAYVTEEDVKRYVGLKTNVSQDTDAQFASKVVKLWAKDYPLRAEGNMYGLPAFEAYARKVEELKKETA